jgi:hypothetical protein
MLTFIICIKPSSDLLPSVLATQVMSCLCVKESSVFIGLSDPSEVVTSGMRRLCGEPLAAGRIDVQVLNDTSLYDGWNRSLGHCDTRWVSFLGYGDLVVNPAFYVEQCTRTNVDAVFSRVLIHGPGSFRIFGQSFRRRCHLFRQTVAFSGALWSREFVSHHRFDPSYLVAGDYEFLLRSGQELRSVFVAAASVAMPAGGLSERARDQARSEIARARGSWRRSRK